MINKIIPKSEVSEVYLAKIESPIEDDDNTLRKMFKHYSNYFKEIYSQGFKTLVIKPNILPTEFIYEGLAVSNPKICINLAKFLKEFGFKLILAEGSTNNSKGEPDSIKAMYNNGFSNIKDLWRQIDCNKDEAGIWFEIYSPGDLQNKSNPFDIELGISKTASLYPVISVAKYKSHDVLGLTLAVKNMMGCLSKARRKSTGEVIDQGSIVKSYMHGFGPRNPRMLTEKENTTISKTALAININRMAKARYPVFSIIDAAPAMEGNGPLRGEVNDLNLVMASKDAVALDTICFSLINLEPHESPYIKNLGRNNLGISDLEHIHIINEGLLFNTRKVAKFKFHKRFQSSKFNENERKLLKKLT